MRPARELSRFNHDPRLGRRGSEIHKEVVNMKFLMTIGDPELVAVVTSGNGGAL